jgi:hypothetical protein
MYFARGSYDQRFSGERISSSKKSKEAISKAESKMVDFAFGGE